MLIKKQGQKPQTIIDEEGNVEEVQSTDDKESAVMSTVIRFAFANAFIMGIVMIFMVMGANTNDPNNNWWTFLKFYFVATTLTTFCTLFGHAIRMATMPDYILTEGMIDSAGKQLFWAGGPEVFGWFCGIVLAGAYVF